MSHSTKNVCDLLGSWFKIRIEIGTYKVDYLHYKIVSEVSPRFCAVCTHTSAWCSNFECTAFSHTLKKEQLKSCYYNFIIYISYTCCTSWDPVWKSGMIHSWIPPLCCYFSHVGNFKVLCRSTSFFLTFDQEECFNALYSLFQCVCIWVNARFDWHIPAT